MSDAAAPVVLVDARNVLRSTWPNIPERELVELAARWATEERRRVVAVFDGPAPAAPDGLDVEVVGTGSESADDWIARASASFQERGERYWLVTSDRELRARAGTGAERTIGGGSFARTLVALRGGFG